MILNDEQVAAMHRQPSERSGFYFLSPSQFHGLLDTIADLKRQLAERDAHEQQAIAAAEEATVDALHDVLMEMYRPDVLPEPVASLYLGLADNLRPKVRGALDAYVQERENAEAQRWMDALNAWPSAASDTRTLLVAKLADRAILAEARWWWPRLLQENMHPTNQSDAAERFAQIEMLAANRAKVKP